MELIPNDYFSGVKYKNESTNNCSYSSTIDIYSTNETSHKFNTKSFRKSIDSKLNGKDFEIRSKKTKSLKQEKTKNTWKKFNLSIEIVDFEEDEVRELNIESQELFVELLSKNKFY